MQADARRATSPKATAKAAEKASEGKATPAEKATRKARECSPSPAPKAPPPPPQDDALEALCAALLALIVAHQATAQSRGALVVLDVLQQVLLLARSFSRCGAGVLSLVTGPHMTGLAWHPAPSSPPSTSSSSTTRSTAEPAPSLPPGQRRLFVPLLGGFEAWGRIEQLTAHLALTVRVLNDLPDLAPTRLDMDELVIDLADAHRELAAALCEASADATGVGVNEPPVIHAARLRQLLDGGEPPWLRQHRDREAREQAARAFSRTT